jgi:hypothetical protein
MVLKEVAVGETKGSESFELPVESGNNVRMVLKFSDVFVVFHW